VWAAVVALEALVIAVFGVYTAVSFYRSTSPIDEAAHVSYVQLIAAEQRLPVLGQDLMSRETYSKRMGTYPRITEPDPAEGFGTASWEAFQPPLYYVLAAIPYALMPGSFESKFLALRFFGVALGIVSLGLCVLIARDLSRDRWPLIAAFAGAVLMSPGFVSRQATVSNAALAPAVALLFGLVALRAARRASAWLTVGACALFGLGLLTHLMLLALAPSVALLIGAGVLRSAGDRRRLAALSVGGLAAIALTVGPWLAWNQSTYGAWTANDRAKDMQAWIVNPDGEPYSLAAAVGAIPDMLLYAHAQEAAGELRGPYSGVGWMLAVVVVAVAVVIGFSPRARPWPTGLFILPLLTTIALLVAVTVLEDWPVMLPRYVMPVIPLAALAGGASLDSFRPESSPDARSPLTSFTSLALGGTAVMVYWATTTDAWTAS
jgi:hypothetical protein